MLLAPRRSAHGVAPQFRFLGSLVQMETAGYESFAGTLSVNCFVDRETV